MGLLPTHGSTGATAQSATQSTEPVQSSGADADPHDPPVRFYRPELDTLRFLAFCGVYIHHALPNQTEWWTARLGAIGAVPAALVRSGAFGVDLFFVLSAYLITELLLQERERTGTIRIGAFLARRALRIWPLYFGFLLVAWIVDPLLGKRGFGTNELLSYVFFVGNWFTAFNGYPSSIAAPLWSISIEEQFYVVWPFLLLASRPTGQALAGDHARLEKTAVSIAIISVLARILLTATHWPHPLVWTSTITRLDTIATGILVASISRRIRIPIIRIARASLAALAIVCLLQVFLPLTDQSFGSSLLVYPLVSIASGILLVAFLRIAPGKASLDAILLSPLLVGAGRFSYGLYVFHVLALSLASRVVSGYLPRQASPLLPLLGFGFTVAIAAFSYRYFEAPFLKLKARLAVIQTR